MNALPTNRVESKVRRTAARRLRDAVIACVEPLETRVLLTAVTYTVPDGSDHSMLLQLQGSSLVLTDNGVVQVSTDFSTVTSVAITGGAGNDLLTVDSSNGSPLPSGGLLFDGAGGGNHLALQGGFFGTEVYAPTSGTSGNISIGGGNINYANLAGITDTSHVFFFSFNTSSATELVNIVDGPVANGMQTTDVNGGTAPQFAATDFANKVYATVNTIDGFDTVNVNNPAGSTGMSSFTLDTYQGADTVNVLAAAPGITTTVTSSDYFSDGNNVVTVGNHGSTQGILGTLLLTNAPAFNDVMLDDSADPTGQTVSLDSVFDPNLGTMVLGVSGLSPGLIEVDPVATSSFTLDGGVGGNTFNVQTDAIGTNNFLNTGAGNDVVNVSFLPGNSPLTIDGQGGNDAVNAFLSVQNGYPSLLGTLTVLNRGGITALSVDTTAETTDQTVSVGGHELTFTTTLPSGTTTSTIDYSLPSGSLLVKTGSGADTFTVSSISLPTTLDGGAGGDSYAIDMSGLGAAISLLDSGADGVDSAALSGLAGATSYRVGPTQTVGNNFAIVNYDSNLEALSLTGGSAADSFVVTPSASTTFTLDGAGPTTTPGDSISVLPSGATGAELDLGPAAGQGVYSFSNRLPVNFVNMESAARPGAAADLALTFSAPDTVLENGHLTYSFSVTNNGPVQADNVVLTASMPFSATFVSAVLGQGSYLLSGGNVVLSLGAMANGATVSGTITFLATDEGVAAASTALVTTDTTDPNTANNGGSASALVLDAPLTVTGGMALAAVEGQMSVAQTVATFVDTGVAEALSDYQSMINWGDNTSSPGTITYDAQTNTFTVSGSHLYLEDGPYTASVVVTHDAAAAVTVSDAVSVSDPAVLATGGLSLSGSEGAAGGFTLATFTDPGGAESTGDYLATINWGDQTSSLGAITFDSSSGRFTVTGNHTYAAEGNYTASVSIAHDSAAAVVVSDTVSVADPAVVAVGGLSFSLAEGTTLLSQSLATFTDPAGADALSDYSASVNWGDGSAASAATISFNAQTGVFSVAGSHLFATAGAYTATVTVHHAAAADVNVTDAVVVSDPAVVMTGGFAFAATEGAASSSQVLASFSDPGGAEGVSHYSASVAWGDGSSSAGTISYNASTGLFSVSGGHLYVQAGSYPISVVVHHDSAPDATAASTASVFDPAVVATGGFTLNSSPGTLTAAAAAQTLATFTDPGGAESLSHYSAAINWGDGTSGAGSIAYSAATGVFSVLGAHTYGGPGSYAVVVTIHHDLAPDVTVLDHAQIASKGKPKLSNVAMTSINEGGTAQLTGNVASPGGPMTLTVNWGPGQGTSTYALAGGATSFSVAHKYLDNPAAGAVSYPVSLTLSTGSDTATATTAAVVKNVAPSATALSGPKGLVRGQPFQLAGAFADVGVLDTHTVKFNWNDGSTSAGSVTESNGSGTFNGSHVFTASGTYTVTCTITDKDGGATTLSQTITVSAVLVENDPVFGGTMLAIGGATGNNKIDVKANKGGRNLKVTVNGVTTDVADTFGRIVVFTQGGNNNVQFAKDVTNPAFVYGGAGNDVIVGGGGPDVFVGGDGNDILVGGSARNILIGGRGSDLLQGGSADDILIAGYTSLDNNDAALAAVFNEWNRATVPAATRVNDLMHGGGLNGSVVLNKSTVFNDNAPDGLSGNGGFDWLLSSSNDFILGSATGQTRTTI